MQVRKLLMITALALALPVTASAQNWFVTPFVGANFGGSADFGDFPDRDDEVQRRLDLGATIGWNPNVVGFEFDFGWSPNFFQDTTGDRNYGFGDSNVTTLMTNLLISAPAGTGLRPYVSSGLGLIRAHISGGTDLFNNLSTNDLGVNIGAGVNGQFTDNVGLRGDLRYFSALRDSDPGDDGTVPSLGSFHFWRGTVGLMFRF